MCALLKFHLNRLKIVDSGAFEKHFIFSRGNAGDNIIYYPLNMRVLDDSHYLPRLSEL